VKLSYYLIAIALLILGFGCSEDVPPPPPDDHTGDGYFYLRIIYVGQASAALITTPDGYNLLYDAGTGSGADDGIIPLLDSLETTFFDMMIMSHYDGDHIGGVDDVLEVVELDGYCFDHGGEHTTGNYTDYVNTIGDKRRTIAVGDTFWFGDEGVRIVCLASDGNGTYVYQENDRSVACIITYKGFDIWIGGDLNGSDEDDREDMESRIAPDVWPVEFYVADHHGSRYSSNETILAALMPDFCGISCGLDNPYGHPHEESLARMTEWTSEIYRTDLSGTITVRVSDDGSFIINTQSREI